MDQKLISNNTNRTANNPLVIPSSPFHSSLTILPSNVEGDCILSEIYLLQITWKKILLTLLGTIFSGGILLILMHWSFRLRQRFLYSYTSSLESSTHLLIVNADSTKSIQRLSQITPEHKAHLESQSQDYQKDQLSSNVGCIQSEQKSDIEQQQTIQKQQQNQQNNFQDEGEVTTNNMNDKYSSMNQPSQTDELSEQFQQENNQIILNSSRSQIYSFTHRELNYFIRNKAVSAMECQVTNATTRQSKPLDPHEVTQSRNLFGKCATHVKIPSVFEYMLVQMTTPFYFLQYASVVLWVFEDYASFSITVLACSFGITIINYILMRVQKVKVASLIPKSEKVNILRRAERNTQLKGSASNLKEEDCLEDTIVVTSGSDEIVIGDIILLKAPMKLPCDCALIEGQALLNEVSLTGESLPAHKYSMNGQEFDVNQDQLQFSYTKNLKHLLCEGTEIVQCTPGAKAKVLRIGYCSFRGQILRSMLYPKLNISDYYPNSLKLMAVLLVSVMVTYCARIPMMYELDFPGQFYFYRFFDALTWLIPPFLPIFLNLSSSLALLRLQTANVIGLDGQKIVEAGSVTEMCFDKTGTLTVDSLNASGVFSASNSQKKLIDENGNCNELSSFERLCFATCHSVKLLEGTNDFIGDPLDIAMLKLSKYTLSHWNFKATPQDQAIQFKATDSNSLSNGTFVDVLKIFDFSPELSRSACIVKTSNGEYLLIVKGAPEILKTMCNKGLSNDFDECVQSECERGQRVIAFATKIIKVDQVNAKREDLECDMEQQCLLSFSNKLKPDSAEVIKRLSLGAVNCRVISGDNLITTIATCRLAGIVEGDDQSRNQGKYNQQQLQGEIEQNEQRQKIPAMISMEYSQGDNSIAITYSSVQLQGQHLSPTIYQAKNDSDINEILRLVLKYKGNFPTNSLPNQFGITGSTLSRLLETISSQEIQQDRDELMKQLIIQTKVFARMRPEQKRTIIQLLQSYGYKVGMIGDGANDCAAIKQGDIGISFAAADAALSAPFSSRGESISCVEKILLEGRCSKQINVEILLVMVAENLIKYIGVMVLLQEASNYSSFQYSYLAYMCSMTLLVLLALSRPVKVLSKSLPSHRFYSWKYLLSIHSQIFIFAVSFIAAYIILCQQSWHVAYTKLAETDGAYSYNMHGQANTIVFLLSSVFYVSSMVTLYQSQPFKEMIHRNYLLLLWVITYYGMAIALAFKPGFFGALSLEESLEDHQLFMLGIIAIPFAATVVMLFIERVIRNYFN